MPDLRSLPHPPYFSHLLPASGQARPLAARSLFSHPSLQPSAALP
ncbi:Hypothetical protein AA314_03065 [Archangium gephyra]|uniref:Uncharacterized protein n=1 Tax=Archangium gephyra TaxID=48 RepID=A0AAC8Q5Q2_9BACT|nr:Hypothetical protein AA314_03065 [Archangium gephyra]